MLARSWWVVEVVSERLLLAAGVLQLQNIVTLDVAEIYADNLLASTVGDFYWTVDWYTAHRLSLVVRDGIVQNVFSWSGGHDKYNDIFRPKYRIKIHH